MDGARRGGPAVLLSNQIRGARMEETSSAGTAATDSIPARKQCRGQISLPAVGRHGLHPPSVRAIETPRRQHKRRCRLVDERVVPTRENSRSFGNERKAASYTFEANFYEGMAPAPIEERGLPIPIPYRDDLRLAFYAQMNFIIWQY